MAPPPPLTLLPRGNRAMSLAEARLRRGWTVVELAVRARVSETTIRQLERGSSGQPRVVTAQAVAAALGLMPAAVTELRDATGYQRPFAARRRLT